MRGRVVSTLFAAVTALTAVTAEAGIFDLGRKSSPAVKQSRPFNVPSELTPYINEAAKKYDLDPMLISAVVFRESAFNPVAVSRRGAQGLMQLMPKTARYLGVTDSFDPRQNILGGAKYLRELHEQFGGNLEMMLGAYNAGPTAVKRAGTATPTQEAKEYVAAVMTYYRALL